MSTTTEGQSDGAVNRRNSSYQVNVLLVKCDFLMDVPNNFDMFSLSLFHDEWFTFWEGVLMAADGIFGVVGLVGIFRIFDAFKS